MSEGGVMTSLAVSLREVAEAVAGDPGSRLRRVDPAGPIGRRIASALDLLLRALDALAAAMLRVDAWTRIADATLAIVELLASTLRGTIDASDEILATLAQVFDDAAAGGRAEPLRAALRTTEGVCDGFAARFDSGELSRVLPSLDDIHAVRAALALLLEEPRDPVAPPRSLVALAAALGERSSPPRVAAAPGPAPAPIDPQETESNHRRHP